MVALLLAASLAVATSLVGTKLLIDWLIAREVGQPIHEDMPDGHTIKAGTPIMGGLAIMGAAVVGYLAAHVRSGLVFTRTGVLVVGCIAGAGRRRARSTTGSSSTTSGTSASPSGPRPPGC